MTDELINVNLIFGVAPLRRPTYEHSYERIGLFNWQWSATCNETGMRMTLGGFWTKDQAIAKTAEYRDLL